MGVTVAYERPNHTRASHDEGLAARSAARRSQLRQPHLLSLALRDAQAEGGDLAARDNVHMRRPQRMPSGGDDAFRQHNRHAGEHASHSDTSAPHLVGLDSLHNLRHWHPGGITKHGMCMSIAWATAGHQARRLPLAKAPAPELPGGSGYEAWMRHSIAQASTVS